MSVDPRTVEEPLAPEDEAPGEQHPDEATVEDAPDDPSRVGLWQGMPEWAQGVIGTALIFLASRAALMVTLAVGTFIIYPTVTIRAELQMWDAGWYMGIIDHGYPQDVPPGTGPEAQSPLAFFPLFPYSARILGWLTGLSPLAAGVITSVLWGMAAAVAIWFLVRRISGARAAYRAAAVFSFYPASMAMLLPFAEGAAIALAAVCLLCLIERRWLWAGLAAGAATAARPTAVVLMGCCAFAAAQAILARREWRSLVSVALAPTGILAYFTFLWVRTGDFLAWFDVEKRGWNQNGTDWGATTREAIRRSLENPVADSLALTAAVATVFAVIALLAVLYWRPPAVVSLYAAGVTFLALTSGFSSRPRYLMSAFPLVVVFGVLARRPPVFAAVLGAFATMLGAYTLLSALPNTVVF